MPPAISPIFGTVLPLGVDISKPGTWDNSTWFAMAIALVATVYILGKSRRKKSDPLSRPPAAFGVSQQRAVERDMQNLLVDLSEMSRQISAQLDTRSKKLELLIDEADKRLARLDTLGALSPTINTSDFHPAPALGTNGDNHFSPILAEPQPPADARHVEIYTLASQGLTSLQIADQLARPKGEIDLILALRPRV